MNYLEFSPPPALAALIKVAWTLELPGASGRPAGLEHLAMPDGCIEVIARSRGASHWIRAQPANFVVGLIDRPAPLQLAAGSAFAGLRLWPWTWSLISGAPLALRNDWIALGDSGLATADRALLNQPWPGSWVPIAALLHDRFTPADLNLAQAALAADQTRTMAQLAGISTRHCQRWFERHAGLTPRAFRRLRRFEQGLRRLQDSQASLAHQAAESGFADQAHMAREFRRYAHSSASRLRGRVRGPFT